MDEQLAGAGLRWVRASVLAAVVLLASILAHASAGGHLPSPLGLVVLMALTTAVLAAVLGRPAGRLRVILLLAGGQAAQHLFMTAVAGHDEVAPAAVGAAEHTTVSAPAHGALEHVGHAAEAPNLLTTWLTHLAQDLTGPNLAMACAHLTAAAALGLWLAAGERALWALIGLLASTPGVLRLAATVTSAVRVLRRRLVALRTAVRRPASWSAPAHLTTGVILASVVVRRGPPLQHSA
jgi:hypothetical protein